MRVSRLAEARLAARKKRESNVRRVWKSEEQATPAARSLSTSSDDAAPRPRRAERRDKRQPSLPPAARGRRSSAHTTPSPPPAVARARPLSAPLLMAWPGSARKQVLKTPAREGGSPSSPRARAYGAARSMSVERGARQTRVSGGGSERRRASVPAARTGDSRPSPPHPLTTIRNSKSPLSARERGIGIRVSVTVSCYSASPLSSLSLVRSENVHLPKPA